MLEGVHALLQEFTQPVPAPVRDIRQHRGSTPARTKAVTGHAPPTTTNARQRAPPPPSSRRHSHTQGVAHKRATQPSRLAHTTTPESTRRCMAMPTAEEGASTTPGHVASRPQGPRVVLTHATATWPKRQPTAQHRRNGVRVRRPPPRSWGTRPLPLTPCIQGKPSHCAEVRDADRVERPGCDPPTAKTT